MSHFVIGKKDGPVQLLADGKWHHLPLIRVDDAELDPQFLVTTQVINGASWVVAVAPPAPGRYDLQYQLNGQQDLVTLPESVLELGVLRWPLATSVDGLTARTSIDTLRRKPADAWADTKRADVEINPPGSKDSERVGIEYKVKGGVLVSLDRILKFTRQWDVR